MSTPQTELELALGGVPAPYRKRLAAAHTKMNAAHRAREHDACGVQAGKICESMIRYLQHELLGSGRPSGRRSPTSPICAGAWSRPRRPPAPRNCGS